MHSEDASDLDDLVRRSLNTPFARLLLEIEAVLCEQTIQLGTVSAWQVGDVLPLGLQEPVDIELRISQRRAARARLRTRKSARIVQFVEWVEN
jgi:flagellar motor switch protein FliM